MNKKGETIIEVIVSLVIIVVSLALFSMSAVVAGRINSKVSIMDKELYESIAEAESRTGTTSEIILELIDDASPNLNIPIVIYDGEMKAFSVKEVEP